MTGATGLLGCAHVRVEALRGRYRAAGLWSGTAVDVVRAAAQQRPTGTALVDRSGQISYAELDARIDSVCQALSDAGVLPSTPLLVLLGNDIDSVVAVHAALRADAVVLLVPRGAGAAQITGILERTGVSSGLAPNSSERDATSLPTGLRWIPWPAATSGAPPVAPRRAADEPAVVLFTSGTTAKPKGVVHSLSTLLKASSNYIAGAELGPADRIFLISPLASVTGVLQALFIAPMLTAPVILEDRWDPVGTCELLVSHGATWYGGPDRLLDRLLDEAVAGNRSVPLRAVYLGGTMLDRRIVERIEDDFGIVVMRAYGSSEVPVSTSGQRSEPRAVRHGNDGLPLPDVQVKVGSTTEPTECCIRGPHTFLGYIDAADDEQAFDGDWYRTGDVAELTDGRVSIVGRLRDIVIRNGLKIPVAEVEAAIERISGVRDCAAYPVPDPTTGERLAVAVVLERGFDLSLSAVAEALVSAGLPKFKLPEELVLWDQPLPVNANGKVDRKLLAAQSQGRPRHLAKRLAGVT